MKRTEAFKSTFFKSEHFADTNITAVISGCVMGEVPGSDERKPILSFSDHDMRLILNATNWDTLADLFGPDSDSWKGQRIELFQDTTRFQNKQVNCIRLRSPEAATPAGHIDHQAPLSETLNDEIPNF